MDCMQTRRAVWRKRGILLIATVLILGCIFWCSVLQDHDDSDWQIAGSDWQIADNKVIEVFDDEIIQNATTLLQNKFQELQDLAMLKYTDVTETCNDDTDTLGLCVDSSCPDTLVPQMSPGNIRSILKPVARVGREKLRKGADAFDVKPENKKYIFLTASSSNHFHESKGAIESLRQNVLPHISNYSLVYYDLGLSQFERNYVESSFGFELRSFPFDKLPNRARYLYCYVWKPLIISAHIRNGEIVVWLDSSIRFLNNMIPLFHRVSKTGVLMGTSGHPFAQHVFLKMFSYFGDRPCHFSKYGELEANFIVFHNDPFVRQVIIEPWTSCALDPTCMCPDESRSLLICPPVRKYGKCHRYDQAAIGYILHKLYRDAVGTIQDHAFHNVERER